MKVSVNYAVEHFGEIALAAERGEEVEIARDKTTLVLLKRSPAAEKRPMSEFVGSWKEKAWISPDFDSPEVNREIQGEFLNDPPGR